MPPRLDMTPYWLIIPAAVVILIAVVVAVAMVAIVYASKSRQGDDER